MFEVSTFSYVERKFFERNFVQRKKRFEQRTALTAFYLTSNVFLINVNAWNLAEKKLVSRTLQINNKEGQFDILPSLHIPQFLQDLWGYSFYLSSHLPPFDGQRYSEVCYNKGHKVLLNTLFLQIKDVTKKMLDIKNNFILNKNIHMNNIWFYNLRIFL